METGDLNLNLNLNLNYRCRSNPTFPPIYNYGGPVGAKLLLHSTNAHLPFRMHCGPGHQFLHRPRIKMHHSLHFPHFHFPHNPMHGVGHGSKKAGMQLFKDVPKGYLAVYVGQGEEQQRFVIPVIHINHPLFEELLKKAEEEYGFEYGKGTITIPCHVAHFQHVEGLIGKEFESTRGVGCFRSSTPDPVWTVSA